MGTSQKDSDIRYMRRALQLAKRGYGKVSPNPMVGAVLVKNGKIIGEGWHQKAGCPHAEVNAFLDASEKGNSTKDAELYVTLEPCSTTGRTPPCTKAIIKSQVSRVVVACLDPNPAHAGNGLRILEQHGLEVLTGTLETEAQSLNRAFFHWICHEQPRVTIKAAMTLDGKIATASGQSKWITGPEARRHAMKLRYGMDAILVGIETVRADDPSLTVRLGKSHQPSKNLRRIVLDSRARIPLKSKLLSDEWKDWTCVVVSKSASKESVQKIQSKVKVWISPNEDRIDLVWLMNQLGKEKVTSLLVEGGGEVNAAFLRLGLVNAVSFYYAPKILGGTSARRAIGGMGAQSFIEATHLSDVKWQKQGEDLVMQAEVKNENHSTIYKD